MYVIDNCILCLKRQVMSNLLVPHHAVGLGISCVEAVQAQMPQEAVSQLFTGDAKGYIEHLTTIKFCIGDRILEIDPIDDIMYVKISVP